MGTIVYRDGKAYVAIVRTLYTEATQLTAHYQLWNVPPEGATLGSDLRNGEYSVYVGRVLIGHYGLVNGGETLPTWTDEVPIPCPKVRGGIKTRWNGMDGRWEKLSKRYGWVAA